jgi:hypothetical protein
MDGLLVSFCGCFIQGTNLTGGEMDSRASLYVVTKREITSSLPGIELR